jgi:hypothetical protein
MPSHARMSTAGRRDRGLGRVRRFWEGLAGSVKVCVRGGVDGGGAWVNEGVGGWVEAGGGGEGEGEGTSA